MALSRKQSNIFVIMEEIINRVAQSGIQVLDPASFLPQESIAVFDLKPYLFRELILKEKDFRQALKELNTSTFQNLTVTITCSSDAIIPKWAFMLVASTLQSVAKEIHFGTLAETTEKIMLKNIDSYDASAYKDQRVVLKGCGDVDIPSAAYVALTQKLQPIAKSIMYGEPCSTVPVYKKAK